jgi:hypothetical protein
LERNLNYEKRISVPDTHARVTNSLYTVAAGDSGDCQIVLKKEYYSLGAARAAFLRAVTVAAIWFWPVTGRLYAIFLHPVCFNSLLSCNRNKPV